MELPVLPVVNGIMPRPNGGVVEGVFLDPFTMASLEAAGVGSKLFVAPLLVRQMEIYPLGVIASLEQLWTNEIYLMCSSCAGEVKFSRMPALFVKLRGLERAKAGGFLVSPKGMVGVNIKVVDLARLRFQFDYPTICGAGWRAHGGFTEVKAVDDVRITIYGYDFDSNRHVELNASINNVIGIEQAHSVEHGIIRSLNEYAACTPKTLIKCLTMEVNELKQSVEAGYRYQIPEIFGVTSAGTCGNPLSNLAKFYVMEDMLKALSKGYSFPRSIEEARRRTLSRLTTELELSTSAGLRILQGLKKGMLHDDTVITPREAVKILKLFPISPWH